MTASAAPTPTARACAAWPTGSPPSTATSRVDSPAGRGTRITRGAAMRVVIADDAVLFREGLARLLEAAGIEVAAQVGDAEELLARVRADPPESAVVDIRMPPDPHRRGAGGGRADPRRAPPGSGVLVLSQYVEPHYALNCSRTAPAASATYSRTASPTLVSWSTPCAASPPAGRSSTPRSSRSSSAGDAPATRSRS